MDLQQQTVLMEAANKLVTESTKHLADTLGRQPSEQESVVFSSSVASIFASWVYAQIYKSAGLEHADAWMQQIFVQIGMGVKGRGVPVTLQINLKSIPEQGQASPIAQEKPPVVICKCVKDDKGNCRLCAEELTNDVTKLVGHVSGVETLQGKKRCQPCINEIFDACLASVIRKDFGTLNPQIRDMVTTMAVQMGVVHGVTEIPQSEQALTELQ